MQSQKIHQKSASMTVEQKWRERFARWRKSGLGISAFCRRNNIKYSSFLYWRRQMVEGKEKNAPGFFELPFGLSMRTGNIPNGGIQLSLPNRWQILIGEKADWETVKKIILMAEQKAC